MVIQGTVFLCSVRLPYNYTTSREKAEKNINIKFFYLRRIKRIWPVYFIVVLTRYLILPGMILFLAYLGVSIGSNSFTQFRWKRYLGFIFRCKFLLKLLRLLVSILNVLWSVSIEEQFYAFGHCSLSLLRVLL